MPNSSYLFADALFNIAVTGDPETDALLFGTVGKTCVGGTAAATLTYSFATAQSLWPDYGSPSEPTTGFAPLANNAQQAVRSALLAWSSIANLQFQEVIDDATGSGTLRIGYTTLGMDASQLAYAYSIAGNAGKRTERRHAFCLGLSLAAVQPSALSCHFQPCRTTLAGFRR